MLLMFPILHFSHMFNNFINMCKIYLYIVYTYMLLQITVNLHTCKRWEVFKNRASLL
jgi:hypothetical protein